MKVSNISVKQIRIFIIFGTILLGSFMVADLVLLPTPLHSTYLDFRLGLQLPVCVLFFTSTFLPKFQKYYQFLLLTTMIAMIYLNFGLIFLCWEQLSFSFPYEGTIMYSLFTFFIFRLNFKFGLPFAVIIISGFILLLLNNPIYGDKNLVNIGFVVVALIVALLGVFRLELASIENNKKTKQLLYLSQTDPLTGVLNRAAFETRFKEKLILNKRHQDNLCVYFIDIDFFKDYNDGYGHPEGDNIIQRQANMLKEIFQRSEDIIARYGGEEFIVVTSNVDELLSQSFAEQIIKKWQIEQHPHNTGKADKYVSCSVGYYFENSQINSSITQLIKNADDALYRAKENGRNCVVQF